MGWSLVATDSAQSTDDNSVTTPGVDTTGANLMVLLALAQPVTGVVVSDSKGNTWTPLTAQQNGVATGTRFYYCLNPIVGSGHTFTVSATGTFPAVIVQAWNGAHAFDAENGANQAAGTTLQPGSVTPAEDNELFVTGCGPGGGGVVTNAVDSGFTETADLDENANAAGGAMAYKVQTSAGAENPTWTASGGAGPAERAAVIATFTALSATFFGIFSDLTRRHRPRAFAPSRPR